MKMPRLKSEKRYRFDYQAFLISGAVCYFLTRYGLSWGGVSALVFSFGIGMTLAIEDLNHSSSARSSKLRLDGED